MAPPASTKERFPFPKENLILKSVAVWKLFESFYRLPWVNQSPDHLPYACAEIKYTFQQFYNIAEIENSLINFKLIY